MTEEMMYVWLGYVFMLSPLIITIVGITHSVYKYSKWEDDWYDQFK